MVALTSFYKTPFSLSINYWVISAWFVSLVFLAPIFSIVLTSFGDSGGLWAHLYQNVLAKYIINTLQLMIGVSFVVLIFGVSTAWIVSRYNFYGHKYFEWLLMLPAACR